MSGTCGVSQINTYFKVALKALYGLDMCDFSVKYAFIIEDIDKLKKSKCQINGHVGFLK